MAQDLRELFAREREQQTHTMKEGHEDRFLSKLDENIPRTKHYRRANRTFWLQIAASVVVVIGLGYYFLFGSKEVVTDPNNNVVDTQENNTQNQSISLGDLSPDLKKIENYYLTNINLELSGLEFNDDNKEVIDSYMEQLAELDAEYRRLNAELNEMGPNDQTINALINNLQLRLQLLQKLKSKLNQLKSSKNEQKTSHIV
ncbi:hypothetical protein [Flagellimonas nanhaiensis]|uniref:Anti-sigma factor n=1 Tax=Flagellimonas nanhaiensis TaxID=2292706 RepID=A0A371JT66_9FLAO|nr:hypothetical protein [Allomuricauda nanhaiensis]RDY61001.1 hypothetical protein DX873_02145 [Allomuricauda nanhaiensis]